jgi:glycosyltransferase involved in cell wall biosynthesis/GT2 family glycosyltransferase
VRASKRRSPGGRAAVPVRVLEIELSRPLDGLGGASGYEEALCLVRLHGSPLGLLRLELPADGLSPEELAGAIEGELAGPLAEHLRSDGVADRGRLEPEGIPGSGTPPCLARLEEFLGRAPSVSVVVPTYERPQGALETARAILACAYPRDRLEVILVDNAPGSEAAVPGDAPEIASGQIALQTEYRAGGANARNAGLDRARGEIVAFTDDDVIVDELWLARLAAAFERGDRIGAASGLVMPLELETTAQLWLEGYGGFTRGFEPRLYDLRGPRPADEPLFPFTLGALGTGGNMAFRADLFRDLGGFDPALGTATPTRGGEDLEALARVLFADRAVAYEPGAIVHHAHPREIADLEARMHGYGVGLSAALTKTILRNRRIAPELLRKLPRGLAFAVDPRSPKNRAKQTDYPKSLTRLELRGMAYGPIAYARGRRHAARAGRRPGPNGLRALIVTDAYPPMIGGANRSAQLLAQHLSARGHTIEIATAWQENVAEVELENGVRVNRIRDLTSRVPGLSEDPYKHNPPPFPDPEAVWRLRRLIRRFQPDLVHSYGWLTHSAAAAMLGTRIPLLLSARDYGNFCAVRSLVRDGRAICDGPAPSKCLRCASREYGIAKGSAAVASVYAARPLLRHKTSAVHAVSRFVARTIDRHLGLESVRSVVIPNFHEDVSGEPVDEEILSRLPEEPFILYVGAIRRIKGVFELCAAYERLPDPPPLVLVGTLTTERDTPDRFPAGATLLQAVPHATVMAMWDRALFGVAPTKSPEALGNVVHEAMSRGIAMIGTRPGGHEDMIEDGASGLLVPAGDSESLAAAMARLIDDPDLRTRMGQAALARSAAFTAAVVLPQLERLYFDTALRGRGERG